jgi:hypothetical protein
VAPAARQGIAAGAAACAVQIDDASRAVELLEQGRCVVLGQSLEGRGQEWARLWTADAKLAGRLEPIRDELDSPSVTPAQHPMVATILTSLTKPSRQRDPC